MTTELKKTRTNLRKAFLKAKGDSTYTTIAALRRQLAVILGEPVTNERLVKLLDNNEAVYSIHAELPRFKSEDKVRWRGRNVAIIGVFPKDAIEGGKLYV